MLISVSILQAGAVPREGKEAERGPARPRAEGAGRSGKAAYPSPAPLDGTGRRAQPSNPNGAAARPPGPGGREGWRRWDVLPLRPRSPAPPGTGLWMPNAVGFERFRAPGQARGGKFASLSSWTQELPGAGIPQRCKASEPRTGSCPATGTCWMGREGWGSWGGGAVKCMKRTVRVSETGPRVVKVQQSRFGKSLRDDN